MTDTAAQRTSALLPKSEPLLRVEDVSMHFRVRQTKLRGSVDYVHAVDGVSFDIAPGEVLGMVGESGSGKSTIARAITRRIRVTSGRIYFQGQDVTSVGGGEMRRLRRDIQMVFQDPYTSLNPKMRIGDAIAEPLRVHRVTSTKEELRARVAELLGLVGLDADAANRFPHAFSGGQRQRIGIARALALDPRLVIADEPVSSLDVSVQAQILHLLQSLQDRLGLAYLFIAHDLAVVRSISDRIAVMYAGKLVELGDAEQVCSAPQHPYTKALLEAAPTPDPDTEMVRTRSVLHGEVPDPVHPPSGCRFESRCSIAEPDCLVSEPLLEPKASGRLVACTYA
jgi:oligopeptide/dipeptide ABC transporter ATP-binding protein